jgi:hypothetical protein
MNSYSLKLTSVLTKQVIACTAAALCAGIILITASVSRVLSRATAQTPPPTVTIQDIPGLANQLALRPMMGVNYTASRAAIINSSGQLDAATGSPGYCVLLDGTSGPCGGSVTGTSGAPGTNFADSEIPAGALNGVNLQFTIQAPPNPSNSLKLYRNGIRLSAGPDFTLVGNVITLTTSNVPQSSDTLAADYRY